MNNGGQPWAHLLEGTVSYPAVGLTDRALERVELVIYLSFKAVLGLDAQGEPEPDGATADLARAATLQVLSLADEQFRSLVAHAPSTYGHGGAYIQIVAGTWVNVLEVQTRDYFVRLQGYVAARTPDIAWFGLLGAGVARLLSFESPRGVVLYRHARNAYGRVFTLNTVQEVFNESGIPLAQRLSPRQLRVMYDDALNGEETPLKTIQNAISGVKRVVALTMIAWGETNLADGELPAQWQSALLNDAAPAGPDPSASEEPTEADEGVVPGPTDDEIEQIGFLAADAEVSFTAEGFNLDDAFADDGAAED